MRRFTALTITLLCIVLLFQMCSLTFCYHYYDGDYPELYTVATNTLYAANGYIYAGEISYDPHIIIIEADSYGRQLFFYSEVEITEGNEYGMGFIIMQRSEGKYAYYYYECTLPYFGAYDSKSGIEKIVEENQSALAELKEKNDWDKPFNDGKMTRAKIDDRSPEGKHRPNKSKANEAAMRILRDNGYTGEDEINLDTFVYCGRDRDGRELYTAYGSTYNKGYDDYTVHCFAIITNPDGSFNKNNIANTTIPSESPEIIEMLKEAAGWND